MLWDVCIWPVVFFIINISPILLKGANSRGWRVIGLVGKKWSLPIANGRYCNESGPIRLIECNSKVMTCIRIEKNMKGIYDTASWQFQYNLLYIPNVHWDPAMLMTFHCLAHISKEGHIYSIYCHDMTVVVIGWNALQQGLQTISLVVSCNSPTTTNYSSFLFWKQWLILIKSDLVHVLMCLVKYCVTIAIIGCMSHAPYQRSYRSILHKQMYCSFVTHVCLARMVSTITNMLLQGEMISSLLTLITKPVQ